MSTESDLNPRQRAYLLALYRRDQEAEQNNKMSRLRGWETRPASEWRWIEYGPRELPKLLNYDPELRVDLGTQGLVDQGAGATWTALADRGLVLREWRPINLGRWRGQTLFVQLTRQGRALARQLTGESALKKSKELSIGAWRVLAFAYERFPATAWIYDAWHNVNLRPPEPIIVSGLGKKLLKLGFVAGYWDNFTLTDAGREFYEREYAHYTQLYPKVKAVNPQEERNDPD